MVDRLRDMRRERIEKGSRERIIEKETKREEGLRDPPFIEFSRSYKLELKHQNLVFTSL